jgi:hypothetical protein
MNLEIQVTSMKTRWPLAGGSPEEPMNWPKWAIEIVQIVDYDPTWAAPGRQILNAVVLIGLELSSDVSSVVL